MLLEAENSLRVVFDEILESNDLFIADEVIQRISSVLPQDLVFLFFVREEKRFVDEKESSRYLNFPYLSFEYNKGEIRRFFSKQQLDERAAELRAKPCVELESPNSFFIVPGNLKEEYRLLLSLTRRVFLTFYKVCGSRDHFIENVSRRFLREYFDEVGSSTRVDMLGAIKEKFGVEVALGFQKNELSFATAKNSSEIIDISAQTTPDFAALLAQPPFLRDLQTSLSRKLTNYGAIASPKMYYCVHTLAEEYFLPSAEAGRERIAEYRVMRRAVLIFLRAENRLSLDAVYNGTKLVASVLRSEAATHREESILQLFQQCLEKEEALGITPQSTRGGLETVIRGLLEPFLSGVVSATLAERVCLRRFDAFEGALIPVVSACRSASARNVDAVPVPAGTADTEKAWAASLSFRRGISVELVHAVRHREEIERAARGQLHVEEVGRPNLRNGFGGDSDALYCAPVQSGSAIVGAVEFSASNVGRLGAEKAYLARVAAACGEVIRRVELANDRAWLSRMSYIHTARHRIEAIARDIRKVDSKSADSLSLLLTSQFGVTSVPDAVDDTDAWGRRVERIRRASYRRANFGDETGQLAMKITSYCEKIRHFPRAVDLIIDVFETLCSNAGHSPLKADDIHFRTLIGPRSTSVVELTYASSGAKLPAARMEQVTVSPIRDPEGSTFHFGLFLLSAQLRMVGGAAQGRFRSEDDLGASPFGVSFLIPVDGLEGLL